MFVNAYMKIVYLVHLFNFSIIINVMIFVHKDLLDIMVYVLNVILHVKHALEKE
jgi:hypothetical protein